MLEPIARRRAHPRHLRQHREVLGVVNPVELGLMLGGNVELDDKDMAHAGRSCLLGVQAIRRNTLCWRLVVCGRILGFHSPRSEASFQAGLLITSALSHS